MFDESSVRFPFGFSLVMIIVDVIWMVLLTLLLDKVLGGGDFSFRFLSGYRGVSIYYYCSNENRM